MALFKSMDQMANTPGTMLPGTIVPILLEASRFHRIIISRMAMRLRNPFVRARSMKFSAEQHISLAKRLRDKARSHNEPIRRQAIERSNSSVTLAMLAAIHRGGITTLGFDFEALSPDWTSIDNKLRV
jgi:hypothetical protein